LGSGPHAPTPALERKRLPGTRSYADVQLALLAVAWFLGTWLPFEFQSAVDSRTSYIYYMVVVMPGIYVAVAYLLSRGWRLRRWPVSVLIGVYLVGVLVAVVLMYPFVPVF
jgi:hypothetical protein